MSLSNRDAILRGVSRVIDREPAHSVFVAGKALLSGTVFKVMPIRVGGGRLYMNPANTVSLFPYLLGTYDWREIELVRQLVREGDTALDVGANIGYYTLRLATLCGDSGRVHSFEPDPVNFELLRTNVRLNSLPNVTLHNVALADFDGSSALYRSKLNAGDYSLAPRSGTTRDPIRVPCYTLDSLRDQISQAPRLLKMDVQGFEPSVLRGASQCLATWQPRPWLLLEFDVEFFTASGQSPLAFLEWLTSRDYVLGRVGIGPMRPTEPAELSGSMAPRKGGFNLLAAPEEERAKFLGLR
jgi:FkbM family methyltransferase